jgi:Flp pilus assembly protein TadG
MIRIPRTRRGRRSGAVMVEFAFIALILFTLLFLIYEYGRFIMTRQVLQNAAREGARYAVVHTYDSTVEEDTIAVVRDRMANVDLSAFGTQATVTVFAADADGNSAGSPLNAPFGTFIGVRIQGNYAFLFPELAFLPATLPLDFVALMNSEAN